MRSPRHTFARFGLAVALVPVVGLVGSRAARADEIPAGWTASNMEAIGYSGLNGIGESFKLAIKQVNGRWYLYMGHFAHPGWTILDVTDPKIGRASCRERG